VLIVAMGVDGEIWAMAMHIGLCEWTSAKLSK